MSITVIGFSGEAGAGKTTWAKWMAEFALESNYVPILMPFAGPLKTAASALGISKEEQPELYRRLLQEIGSKLRDPDYVPGTTGPDYFLNLQDKAFQRQARAAAERSDDKGVLILVDDVRYENEVDLIVRGWQGTMVHIGCLECTQDQSEFRNHESEKMAREYNLYSAGDYAPDQGINNSADQRDAWKTERDAEGNPLRWYPLQGILGSAELGTSTLPGGADG